jgi:hypothetical protein
MMKSISYWIIRTLGDTYPNDAEFGKVMREMLKQYENNG